MIEALVDAREFSAGSIRTALAAPVGTEQAPRSVGPFVLVAHALPQRWEPGELPPDHDVRPHPHIGLAAVTYMLEGHTTHRDSLGSRHEVGPGGVHYMIAGRGVVHSERFDRLRTLGGTMSLLQILLALPDGAEEAEPRFEHVDAHDVPRIDDDGAAVSRLAGDDTALAFPAPMFLHDVRLAAGGRYRLPSGEIQRAVHVLDGSARVGDTAVALRQTAVLADGEIVVSAEGPARVLAFGGAPVGPRYMWWNFIHSSLDRVEAAKAAWRTRAMAPPIGDTESFTPSPPDDGRPLRRLNAPRTPP